VVQLPEDDLAALSVVLVVPQGRSMLLSGMERFQSGSSMLRGRWDWGRGGRGVVMMGNFRELQVIFQATAEIRNL
jgi:hypothetical protein